MDREQLMRQDGMDNLLMKSPLPCKVINDKILNYVDRYGDDDKDKWFQGYKLRYNQHIHLEKHPFPEV